MHLPSICRSDVVYLPCDSEVIATIISRMINDTNFLIQFIRLLIAFGVYDCPELLDDAMDMAFDDANATDREPSRCMSGS